MFDERKKHDKNTYAKSTEKGSNRKHFTVLFALDVKSISGINDANNNCLNRMGIKILQTNSQLVSYSRIFFSKRGIN